MATPLRLFRLSVLSLRLGLVKHVPASVNFRRYLLSNAYACSEAWKNHLDDPALQEVHLPEFSNQIYDYLAKNKKVSPIDMNVLAHNFDRIQDEDEAEYIADIIARYNRCKSSINRSEATCHATVRGFMNTGYTDILVEMLTDRLHYGLFPNSYSLNLLLDHFIKEKDYHNAAKVSYCSMIQEDFSNPINARLCLYAAVHHLLTCNIDDLVPPPKEQSDGEEKWVKVDYIRYPYYDDHFDIKDERFLLGKTLLMLGGVTNIEMPDNLRTSLKVIGFGLYHKFDRGVALLRDILKSTNSSVSQQALDYFESSLEKVEARDANEPEVEMGLRTIDDVIHRLLPTTEQKAAYQAELKHLKETLNAEGKVQGDFNIGPVVESVVTNGLSQLEEADITLQVKFFDEWKLQRKQELEIQIAEYRKEERIAEMVEQIKELKRKEELLTYFDFEEKIRLHVSDEARASHERELVLSKE